MTCLKWISIAAAACVLPLANPAAAAEPGFYVTATLGAADEDPASIGTNFASTQGIIHVDPDRIDVDNGNVAWAVGLGYRINDYLSGEIEYTDFGTTDINEHYSVPNLVPFPFPTELDVSYSSQITGPVVSVLGTLPIGRNFELFLRGGVLFASREREMPAIYTINGGQKQEFADQVWVAGGGVSWSFAKRWAIRAEYQRTGDFDETIVMGSTQVNRASVSALWRF